jgi:hypothetical protein
MATKKKKTNKKASRKKATKKKPLKKAALKAKPQAKKAAKKPGKKPGGRRTGFNAKREVVDSVAFEPTGRGARSGGQSGDLQGLSGREAANSESVDELLEEGNAFEAEVVKGIEDADDADEGEVHTHEVPEDDVPDEYREKD